jgi:hypothetical protein
LQIFTPSRYHRGVKSTVKPGDKVRVKTGKLAGRRGVLVKKTASGWVVAFDGDVPKATILLDELTNFSAAARQAWDRMPNRKVGRPVGTKVSDRVSVIFRIERSIWDEFLDAERAGLVSDRTTIINTCLRKLLKSAKSQRATAR